MVLITSYNYSIHGVYKPTYNWGAPPCGAPILGEISVSHVGDALKPMDERPVKELLQYTQYPVVISS